LFILYNITIYTFKYYCKIALFLLFISYIKKQNIEEVRAFPHIIKIPSAKEEGILINGFIKINI